MMYFAHSENRISCKHLAKKHLASVAKYAGLFAGKALWRDEAILSGLLHDIGKYADLFQARLRGEVDGLDHWSMGAWLALKEHRVAVAAALAIQGHHIGLQRGSQEALRSIDPKSLAQHHPLGLRLSDYDLDRLKERAAADGIVFSSPQKVAVPLTTGFTNSVASMLDVRMLFSCLVDADFLDTEAHFEGDGQGKCYRDSGPDLEADKALKALAEFMAGTIRSGSKADQSVIGARNALWNMVVMAAERAPGLLTLTAPTGSGKTLAMLKFALEHAARNGMKRIILAVPFLSIIEQTAAIYRAVFESFPPYYVLEHHSLAGLGSEEATTDAEFAAERGRRMLAENWDSPIIITTNVQLLESLFSNRPSSCRKLHNLMESVIIFDEAQTLPQALAVPTLAALSHLSATYRTTVLFATATQPAFDALAGAVSKLAPTGWRPDEAVPDHSRLYKVLRRYEISWPFPGETKSWPVLAAEIRDTSQVLCVVNLKSHASAILKELQNDDNVFHLSTNLCALHRRAVLDKVRHCLVNHQQCRLISTQCIEAGVDVDFPLVYRALAPLDAIAQAAGRCNREGRLTDDNGNRKMGEVRIFAPAVDGDFRKRYPTFAYFQAAKITETMLIEAGKTGLDLNDPAVFRDYYHRLYDLSKPETQNQALRDAATAVDFVRVAKEYRLIEQAAIQVLVPYTPCRNLFEELDHENDIMGISAKWIRRAQGLAVSIFRPKMGHPAWEVLIPAKLRYGKGESDEWFILEDRSGELYDGVFGLRLPQAQQIFIA